MSLDLILLGAVFVFVVLLLGSVLGKRIGHENTRPDLNSAADTDEKPGARARDTIKGSGKEPGKGSGADVFTFPGGAPVDPDDPNAPTTGAESAAAVLTRIKMAEPSFDFDDFQEIARAVFSIVLKSFAEGDRDQLKQLLDANLYQSIDRVIAEREKADQRLELHLVGINSVVLKSARRDGDRVCLTLRFESDQSQATFGASDQVVSGDPNQVVPHIDLWTFTRRPGDPDPTWRLLFMETEAEASPEGASD